MRSRLVVVAACVRERERVTLGRVCLQAMDLQQLFLAMTEDTRIIVVKLADRLHNMRTMAAMPEHKQRKIAAETLAVFAPLAGLLGLWTIKLELEDLSLMCGAPQKHLIVWIDCAKSLRPALPGSPRCAASAPSSALPVRARARPVPNEERINDKYHQLRRGAQVTQSRTCTASWGAD